MLPVVLRLAAAMLPVKVAAPVVALIVTRVIPLVSSCRSLLSLVPRMAAAAKLLPPLTKTLEAVVPFMTVQVTVSPRAVMASLAPQAAG